MNVTVYLPVLEPESLVVGQQVVQLLDVSQTRQEHQDRSVQAGELRRLVCGRHVITISDQPIFAFFLHVSVSADLQTVQ